MNNFEQRLTGGHPNSLGNTVEVVEEVLANHANFDELFNCYFSEDEVVRLRVSNAMKRVCAEEKQLLVPYIDRFLTEIADIDQASTQWTLCQLFLQLEKQMNDEQYEQALAIVKRNLEFHNDWIVLNEVMRTLSTWAEKNDSLREWVIPHLTRLSRDSRKSVSGRAVKILKKWGA